MRGASERNGRRVGCGVDKGSLDWSFPRRRESRELRWYLDPRLRGDDGRLSGRRGEAFLDPRLREDDIRPTGRMSLAVRGDRLLGPGDLGGALRVFKIYALAGPGVDLGNALTFLQAP